MPEPDFSPELILGVLARHLDSRARTGHGS